MAIAFGNVTRISAGGSGSSPVTGNSPSVSGSNLLGVMKLAMDGNRTASGITWGAGNAMTELAAAKVTGMSTAGGTSLAAMQMFYIVNPPTGVSTITITIGGNTVNLCFASIEYYTGVDQGTPIDTSTFTTFTSASSISPSFTTGVANTFLLDQALSLNSNTVMTAGGSQTITQSAQTTQQDVRCSYRSVASAGSVTNSWSGGTTTWGWNAASIRPFIASGFGSQLAALGVG